MGGRQMRSMHAVPSAHADSAAYWIGRVALLLRQNHRRVRIIVYSLAIERFKVVA
jgi:hypothetical protein